MSDIDHPPIPAPTPPPRTPRQIIPKKWIINPVWSGSPGCKFDCVIVKDGLIKIIIEIKAEKYKKEQRNYDRQHTKYAIFGVPVLFCFGIEGIPNTIAEIERLFLL